MTVAQTDRFGDSDFPHCLLKYWNWILPITFQLQSDLSTDQFVAAPVKAYSENYYTKVSSAKPVNYGTKGTFASSNWPPYRGLSYSWTVSDDSEFDAGNFVMFGGLGLVIEEFNDVWEYSRSLGQWRWKNGPNIPNQPEVNKGDYVFDRANVPSARAGGSSMITDQSTALFLFSGASLVGYHFYSDVWEFNLELKMWRRIRPGITTHAVTGTKRVFNVANSPASGYRYNGFHKLSIDRNFQLNSFIGFLGGIDADHAVNQVWVYSGLRNEWAFLHGSIAWDDRTGKHNPVAGVGCADPTYVPPARAGHQTWLVDNYLYMFGGAYYMQDYNLDEYADMWRFDIDQGLWCWMSGPTQVNQPLDIPKRLEYDSGIVAAWRVSGAYWLSTTNDVGTDSVHLMIFAGAGEADYTGCNDVFAYSPHRNEWKYTNGTLIDPSTQFEDSEYPAWRSGVTWWPIGNTGEVYFFGGGYGNRSEGTILPYGDIWKYDKLEYSCGDYDRDDPEACSEHGSCVAPSECVCETGWRGDDCEKSSSSGIGAGGWVGVGIGISVVFIVAIVVVNVVLCFFCIRSRRGAGAVGGSRTPAEKTPALVARRSRRPEQDGSSINAYGTFDGGSGGEGEGVETVSKPKGAPRRMGSSLRREEVAAYEQLPRGDEPAPRRKIREPILDEDDLGHELTLLEEKDDL